MAGLCSQKLLFNKAGTIWKSKEGLCFRRCSPWCSNNRNFHSSSPQYKKKDEEAGSTAKCVEKCSKKQREVMTALEDAQNRYLQPRTPILTGHKFIMSPPKVEPYVDVYIEEACRIREECRAMREGGGKKKK